MHADQRGFETVGETPRNLQARLEPAVTSELNQNCTIGHGRAPLVAA